MKIQQSCLVALGLVSVATAVEFIEPNRSSKWLIGQDVNQRIEWRNHNASDDRTVSVQLQDSTRRYSYYLRNRVPVATKQTTVRLPSDVTAGEYRLSLMTIDDIVVGESEPFIVLRNDSLKSPQIASSCVVVAPTVTCLVEPIVSYTTRCEL